MSRYQRCRYHIQCHATAFPISPPWTRQFSLITINHSTTRSKQLHLGFSTWPIGFFSVVSPSRRDSIASAIHLGFSRRALRALIAQALVATDGPTLEENQFNLHHPSTSTSTTHGTVVCFSPAFLLQSFVHSILFAGPVGQCLFYHEHRNCNRHKPEPLHGRLQWRHQTKRPHA